MPSLLPVLVNQILPFAFRTCLPVILVRKGFINTVNDLCFGAQPALTMNLQLAKATMIGIGFAIKAT